MNSMFRYSKIPVNKERANHREKNLTEIEDNVITLCGISGTTIKAIIWRENIGEGTKEFLNLRK